MIKSLKFSDIIYLGNMVIILIMRAFTRYFERHTFDRPAGTFYEDLFGEKSDIKNKIRMLIRFEDNME